MVYSVFRTWVPLFPSAVYGTPCWSYACKQEFSSRCFVPIGTSPPARQDSRELRVANLALWICFCLASRHLLHIRTITPSSPSLCLPILNLSGRRTISAFPVASRLDVGAFSLYSCERSELDPWSCDSEEPDTCDFP
jgi:hypothetical protein